MSTDGALPVYQENKFLSRTFDRAEARILNFREKFEKSYKDWLGPILLDPEKSLEEWEEKKKRTEDAIDIRKARGRRLSADSYTGRRRTRSPSGESIIESTSLTNLPTAQELQAKIHEETKMSGLSISSIKTPPPFTRPAFTNRTDHNANEEKPRRASDCYDTEKAREAVHDGIDRSSTNYHERTGLMKRSGRKSSVERKLEQELKTGENEQKLEQVVEQGSYKVHEQQVYTDIKVEEGPGGMTKTNFVYQQPRLPGGSRVQKATGKLLNQYEEDMKFAYDRDGDSEEIRASVRDIKQNLNRSGGKRSKEKDEVEKELEILRETAGERQMGYDSSDDERDKKPQKEEVKFRRPLTSIKTKYLAKAKGERICTSSDSEDDHRKTPERVEILPASVAVRDVKNLYSTNDIPWQHPVEKHDPRAEIQSSPFSESKKYYVENENMIPWQHPVEKFDPRQEIEGAVVKSAIGYYKKIEGEIMWQHPVEKTDARAEIEGPVVKSTLSYYKEIEGAIPWQHPVVKEDPRQDIDGSTFKSAKTYYQENEGEVPWQHPVEKMNAKDEIDTGNVMTASTYFKEIECKKEEGPTSPIQKPIVSMVKNPFQVMQERRLKVDEGMDEEDGPSDHPSRRPNKDDVVYIDATQVRAYRESYKKLEADATKSPELLSHKPKNKLIVDEEAFDVMAKHRRKSGEEDQDSFRSDRLRASYEMEQRLEKEVYREIDVHQVRSSRETYRTLESRTDDLSPVNKPRARYLGFDDAQLRMAEHRRRVEEEGELVEGSYKTGTTYSSRGETESSDQVHVSSSPRSPSISISSTARQ